MSGPLLRPTFEHTAMGDAAEVASRIRAALGRDHPTLGASWARGGLHALLTVPRDRRRWWSPWLHLDVRTHQLETSASIVFGRFSPNPALWTASMLAMIALLAIALFGVALGLSQMTLERPAWGWWLGVLAVVAASGFVTGARIAQRLASAQMNELRAAVEAASGAVNINAEA